MLRQVKDSTRRAQKRALKTSDETLYRQEEDRAYHFKREHQKRQLKFYGRIKHVNPKSEHVKLW